MAGFISYAQENIWGLGATEEEALQEAERHGGKDIEDIDTAPATERLLAAVVAFTAGRPVYPDDLKWGIQQGVADLAA